MNDDDCTECCGKGWVEWPSYGGMGEQYSHTCDACEGAGKKNTDNIVKEKS